MLTKAVLRGISKRQAIECCVRSVLSSRERSAMADVRVLLKAQTFAFGRAGLEALYLTPSHRETGRACRVRGVR